MCNGTANRQSQGATATQPGELAKEVRMDSVVNVLGPTEADFRLRLEFGPFIITPREPGNF